MTDGNALGTNWSEEEITRAQELLKARRDQLAAPEERFVGELVVDSLHVLATQQEHAVDGFARRAGVSVPVHQSGDFAQRITSVTEAMVSVRAMVPPARFARAHVEKSRLERNRRLSLAKGRGVPDDDGVLAVAVASVTPTGEAVSLLSSVMERRESLSVGRSIQAPPKHGALVVLLGDVDTGKTAAGARLVALHHREALYIRASALPPPDGTLDQVSFDRQASVEKIQAMIRGVDLLVIDEIGVESNPWWVTEWCCLRWPKKVTFVLGNSTGKAFRERYSDPRFYSRLIDRQDPKILPNGGMFTLKTAAGMHKLAAPR